MNQRTEIVVNQNHSVLVDSADEDVSQLRWYVGPHLHVFRKSSGKTVYLHRVIVERVIGRPLCKGEVVDHRDGDPLNNQRNNLRLAIASDNSRNSKKRRDNTSGYKGVSFSKKLNKWQATIGVDGKLIYLGIYGTPEEAYAVYCEAARKHFGEFARLA